MKHMYLASISVFALLLGAQPIATADDSISVLFTDEEVRIITHWYRDQAASPPANQGRKPKRLPPGIAKNLERGKPLPPGIARQYLPDDLVRALPPPRDGYERIVVDGKVLLVDIGTRIIHDILADLILD